jgi:Tol biopolymer transport system component
MGREGLMAGTSGSPDLTMASVDAEPDGQTTAPPTARIAWLATGVAIWFVGAFSLLVWAFSHRVDADLFLSVHAVPLYLGIGISVVVLVALAIRAARQGRGWRRALPDGYGVLAAGVLALVAGLIADVGWREGIGIPEGLSVGLAPSRLVLIGGLVVIAVAPLRMALRSSGAGTPRWAAVASASMVLWLLLLPGLVHPAANGLLKQAAFIPNAEIWSMDADGDHQTRLIEAHDGIQAWNAVWSPDAKHLAYTRLVIGNHPPLDVPDEADIWIAAADGSDAHPLVEGPGWQWLPHWSPDGVWIAYTNEAEGGPWAATGPAGLGGGGILGTGIGFGPTNPVRTYADIWRVRADGTGSPERLTDAPGDDRAAAYSPDGRQLALDSTRGGGTEIWIMNADGSGAARQLTFEHGYTWGATWSPDGRHIAFNAWRPGGGNDDIFVIGADGSGEQRLTSDPADELEPAWSPDGTRIAFRRLAGPPPGGEIWSMAANGSDQRELSRDPGAADDVTSGGGAWSTDGRIAFMRAENPPGDSDPLIREVLATTTVLLATMLVAFIAVLLARTGPPFGAFALLLGIPTAIIGTTGDGVEFIPAAVVAGLIVDVLVRFAPDRWKIAAAGAGSAAAFVVSSEITVAVTHTNLAWSFSLVTGVVVAAAAIGWGLATAIGGRAAGGTEVRP